MQVFWTGIFERKVKNAGGEITIFEVFILFLFHVSFSFFS